MGTYTIIQDIEAEDKLLGPLTLRQFIYACITVGSLFLAFMVSKANIFVAIPFLLPAAIFGFLAAPLKKDQPTETWAVAKIRYIFKPRKRIWDQTGQKDLVTITAPKQLNIDYTDGLSQHDVRSRLKILATTIDSRGWAIKNLPSGASMPALPAANSASDRLTGGTASPVSNLAQVGTDEPIDILDDSAHISQSFDQMISRSSQEHKQRIIEGLQNDSASQQQVSQPPVAAWFSPTTQPLNDNLQAQPVDTSASQNLPQVDEQALLKDLDQRKLPDNLANQNLKTIQPLTEAELSAPASPLAAAPLIPVAATTPAAAPVATSQNAPTPISQKPLPPTTPAEPNPAILELSRNDDLDVATIARQFNKKSEPDEVVISLRN